MQAGPSPTTPPKTLTRVRAKVSAKALRHNLAYMQAQAGVPILWPLKANAYGHGLEAVAPVALAAPEVWGMAVATPDEALQLSSIVQRLTRAQGLPAKPILVFGPSYPREWEALTAAGIHLTVSTLEDARGLPAGSRAHLKVNTGMNRAGARPSEALTIGRHLEERGLLTGIYSHFSEAEAPETTLSWTQFTLFHQVAAQFPNALKHMGNSSAVLNLGPLPGMNLVRPGFTCYGVMPPIPTPDLVPALTLQARVTYLHAAYAGEQVGYNGLDTLGRDSLIATLPIGYADGYPRRATVQAEVLIAGQRRPVLGRVCMDQIMVDATGLDVRLGDWVTLWGFDEYGNELHISELAAWSGMAEYELLTRMGSRVRRVAAP